METKKTESEKKSVARKLTITDRVRLYLKTASADPKKVERIIEMCNEFLASKKQIRIVEIEKQLSELNAELETLKAA